MKDPYTWRNSDVLKNKLGIRNAETLREKETDLVTARGRELLSAARGPARSPDEYRALHRQLFQDVYEWAGRYRTVDISKMGSTFARAHFVDASMRQEFSQLSDPEQLQRMDRNAFADTMARHLSELNAIHPFREGNGRVMRAHLELHARAAEKQFDPAVIERGAWMAASESSFMSANHAPLSKVILDALPVEQQRQEPLRGAAGIALPPPMGALMPPGEMRSVTIAQAKQQVDRYLPTAQMMAERQTEQMSRMGQGTADMARIMRGFQQEVAFLQDAKGPMHLLQIIEQRRYGEIQVRWSEGMDSLQRVRAISAGAAQFLEKMSDRDIRAADRALANAITPRSVGQVDIRMGRSFVENSAETNRSDERFAPYQRRIDSMLEAAAKRGADKQAIDDLANKAVKTVGDALSRGDDPKDALQQLVPSKSRGR